MTTPTDSNDISRDAWDANAQVWDAKMGDQGNDFFRLLCWPVLTEFLNIQPGQHILDIACGNGLASRKLADLGATVTAFDFSANLIELAKQRNTQYETRITYSIADATNESALLALPGLFDSALSNMALFDMPEIEPLFRALSKLLKPGGCFVFSITHPAFNNASSIHVAEELFDDEGRVKTVYSIKVSRYMTPYRASGLALRNQPKPQLLFERPLQYYLNVGFQNGFVLDGFAERAFPPDSPQPNPLGWGGQFGEIPPVLIARMRLSNP